MEKTKKKKKENIIYNSFATPPRMTKKGQTEFSRFESFMAKMEYEKNKEKLQNKKLNKIRNLKDKQN